jgi:glycosyltransferase involved in cell wall biosynthesis
MRIGIYLNDLSPEDGGAHTFEAEILQSLLHSAAQSQHTFILFSHQAETVARQQSSSPSIQWVYVPRPELAQRVQAKVRYSLINPINQVSKIQIPLAGKNAKEIIWRKTIETYQIDMVWSFGPYTICEHVPHAITIWDLEHRSQPYFPEVTNAGQWEAREAMYSQLAPKASFIFVGTEAGKAEVERFYQVPSSRVKVMPFPTPGFVLNPPSSDVSIFEKYHLPSKYIFYPAQFWPHKNHANLLLALQHLKETANLIVPVVFSGSNKGNQSYIKQLAIDLGLTEQVHFLGFIPQSDLVALYQNAVALTFVSLCGPDNLPPLEAFALGCPVIASKVSGAVEQLQDAALLVDAIDPKHIAASIQQVWLNESIRQDLIQKGLQRAQSWTGTDYVEQVYGVLDEFQAIRRCWETGIIYES